MKNLQFDNLINTQIAYTQVPIKISNFHYSLMTHDKIRITGKFGNKTREIFGALRKSDCVKKSLLG